MKSIAFIAAALLAAAGEAFPDRMVSAREAGHNVVGRGLEGPKETPQLGVETFQGCFKSSGELTKNFTDVGNSKGSCITSFCKPNKYKVGGMTGANQCWCGNKYPPARDLVTDDKCNTPCQGYSLEACGGFSGGQQYWSIYHTGIDLIVDNSERSSLSTTTSATSAPTASATKPAETVLVTQSAAPEDDKKKGGKNVGGIVAGVVVGFVIIAAALGGGYMFLRRKRNKEIEEEHRRNAAVSAFIGKPPSSSGGMSMTDSRMDPVMAHRRMSDGSIADNQDYSRRILRVTNA
ncbi:hypothetical protein QBC43DRAFT_137637 [Cladorrhinum sp. PSN259]|nr:hypothetical protein QBC43DRAFT_137637 [Cladorrhinum sp. PSN259]